MYKFAALGLSPFKIRATSASNLNGPPFAGRLKVSVRADAAQIRGLNFPAAPILRDAKLRYDLAIISLRRSA